MAIIPTPKANKSGSVITIPLASSFCAFNYPAGDLVAFFPFHRVALPLVKARDFSLNKAVPESTAKLADPLDIFSSAIMVLKSALDFGRIQNSSSSELLSDTS